MMYVNSHTFTETKRHICWPCAVLWVGVPLFWVTLFALVLL